MEDFGINIAEARKAYELVKASTDSTMARGTLPVHGVELEREYAQRLVSTVAAWYESRIAVAIIELKDSTRKGIHNA